MAILLCLYLFLRSLTDAPSLMAGFDPNIRLILTLSLWACCIAEGFFIGRWIALRERI